MRLESIAPVANPYSKSSRNGQTLCHRYLWVGASRQGCQYVYTCSFPELRYFPPVWVSPSSFYPALLLQPPSFIFLQAHVSSILYPPTLPSSMAVVVVEVDFSLSLTLFLLSSNPHHSFSPSVTTWNAGSGWILAVSLLVRLFPLHAPVLP